MIRSSRSPMMCAAFISPGRHSSSVFCRTGSQPFSTAPSSCSCPWSASSSHSSRSCRGSTTGVCVQRILRWYRALKHLERDLAKNPHPRVHRAQGEGTRSYRAEGVEDSVPDQFAPDTLYFARSRGIRTPAHCPSARGATGAKSAAAGVVVKTAGSSGLMDSLAFGR